MVRVLRPQGQPDHRGSRVPGTRDPRRQRRACRAPYSRYVLRETGWPAAAEAAHIRRHEVGLQGRRSVMFERRLYYHIDWALLAAILSLCGAGVVMIYSTTSDPTRALSHLWITQLYAIALGLIAMTVTLSVDYRAFTDKSHWIYIALIAVLVYVMFFGTVQMG